MMKKNSVFTRLLTVKDNSSRNLRTSQPQLPEKAVRNEKKTPKIKSCLKKSTSEEVKIIESISIFPACRLNVHREAENNSLTGQ